MRGVVVVVVLAGVLSAPAAPSPFPRAERRRQNDPNLLLGEWLLVSEGEKPVRHDDRYVIRLSAGEMHVVEGHERHRRWALKTNCNATPAQIDLIRLSADNDDEESRTVRGIFRVTGDTLTLGLRDHRRPTDFEDARVLIFKRLKR